MISAPEQIKPVAKVDASKHIALAVSTIRKQCSHLRHKSNLHITESDEFGEMMIVLSRCAIKYDSGYKTAFSTLAVAAMTNRLIEMYNWSRRRKRQGLKQHQLENWQILDHKNSVPEIDETKDIVNRLLANDKRDDARHKQYKELLRQHYLEGKTHIEIAKQLNCTRQRIGQLLDAAKETARRQYATLDNPK